MSFKIAIATDDGNRIAQHFGRTPLFVVFTIDQGRVIDRELRPNTFTGHYRGGMGMGEGGAMRSFDDSDHHKEVQSSVLQGLGDCRAVISAGGGRRIWETLQNAGIAMIITDRFSVDDALETYLKGELTDTGERCEGQE